MADNIPVTPGSGKTVATDEVTDGTLGTVQVQFIKLMDGTLDSTNKLSVSAAGAAKVDGSAATQPISAASLPLPTGASTSANQTTGNSSLSSIDGKTAALVSGRVPVDPSGVTSPISAASLPLPSGASTSAKQPALGTAGTPSADVITVQGVTSMTALKVDGSAVTQPVSGSISVSNFPATQPVSGTVTANAGIGNFTVVQPTGTNLHTVIDSGTVTANQGTANATPWNENLAQVNGVALGSPSAYGTSPGAVNVIGVNANITNPVQVAAANLSVTATGAGAAAVTLTIPAVASQFHYITGIEILCYSLAARTGAATPVLVTSTNLPGSNVWDFQSAGAIGTSERQLTFPNSPIKSSVVNTATTIVCPATTSVIWRVNVYYFTAT